MREATPNKFTKNEIATLKIFSAYASKTGDKMGSKGYNARLSKLTSNIRSEMAKTPKPAASVVAPAKAVVSSPKQETLKERNDRRKADQKEENRLRDEKNKTRNAEAKRKTQERYK
jgi:Tfp pilus assembly protein FimV